MRRSLPFALAVGLNASLGALTASAQTPAVTATAPSTSVQYVRVEGADYSFTLPATIKSGLTVLNLVNVGRDVHNMTLLALPPGRTMKQFLDTFHANGKRPPWAPVLGETSTIKPGAEAFITARLKPGSYVLACFLAAADGRSHTEVGMVQLVTAK